MLPSLILHEFRSFRCTFRFFHSSFATLERCRLRRHLNDALVLLCALASRGSTPLTGSILQLLVFTFHLVHLGGSWYGMRLQCIHSQEKQRVKTDGWAEEQQEQERGFQVQGGGVNSSTSIACESHHITPN